MNLCVCPSTGEQGQSLKMQSLSLGTTGTKLVFVSVLRRAGTDTTCQALSLGTDTPYYYVIGTVTVPRFARSVTGERKGGLSGAAYPSLPLSVTKKNLSRTKANYGR